MKCNKKPFGNQKMSVTITGVVEVLIPQALWERMKKVKELNPKLTFTWMSRYALFRILRHAKDEKAMKKLLSNPKFKRLLEEDKETPKIRSKCHRHSVCFYGEDEDIIQQLSVQMRVSVSALIRAGLLWYLEELEGESMPNSLADSLGGVKKYAKMSREKLIAFGTKVVKEKTQRVKSVYFVPVRSFRRMVLFGEEDFWWD